MTASPDKPRLDRFEGCLTGLAVGSALGGITQGLSRHEIRARWGRVSDFQPSENRRAGEFGADAEAAIMLGEAIVRGGGFDPEAVAGALSDWCTRGNPTRRDHSTAEACERLRSGVPWREAGSDYGATGPAARAAPVGLVRCRNHDRLAQDAADSSLITHRDARAMAGAVAMAAGVSSLVGADAIDARSFVGVGAQAAGSYSAQMAAALAGVSEVLDLPPRVALDHLGYSSFALEAVPAAVYCFAVLPDDFAECVLLAVNAGGDAAIAAMAGALSGAYLGLARVPAHWAQGVEQSQRLLQLARDLHALA